MTINSLTSVRVTFCHPMSYDQAFGFQSLTDFGIGWRACNVISDGDKCCNENKGEKGTGNAGV